jgi:hypothetical protein
MILYARECVANLILPLLLLLLLLLPLLPTPSLLLLLLPQTITTTIAATTTTKQLPLLLLLKLLLLQLLLLPQLPPLQPLQLMVLYCRILLHCVYLTFSFTSSVYVQLRLMFTLLLFIINVYYKCLQNFPSSDVQVVVLK